MGDMPYGDGFGLELGQQGSGRSFLHIVIDGICRLTFNIQVCLY